MQTRDWLFIAVLLWGLWHALGGALPIAPPPPTVKATAATFVYEKDEHAVPAAVRAALDKLNREKKIVATIFDDDVTDGTGEVPEQYRTALDEAKKAGLPALVVTNGNDVVKVVKSPTTMEQVLEAVP